MRFKSERVELLEENEDDLKAKLNSSNGKIEELKLQSADWAAKRLHAENELLAESERLNLREREVEELKWNIANLEQKQLEIEKKLGGKLKREEQIKDLHQMTTLIGQFRKKQV